MLFMTHLCVIAVFAMFFKQKDIKKGNDMIRITTLTTAKATRFSTISRSGTGSTVTGRAVSRGTTTEAQSGGTQAPSSLSAFRQSARACFR